MSTLSELFAQIDVNGDGTMEWDEFTSFIVETGKTASGHEPSSIQMYHQSPWEDSTKHSTHLNRIYYFPAIDKFGATEHASNVLKLYQPSGQPLRSIARKEGKVLSAAHIPERSQYAISSSDLQITLYDDQSLRLSRSFFTPSSQMCLSWAKETSTLYSGGVSGVLYAWDIDTMESRFQMGTVGKSGAGVESHRDMILDLLNIPSLESIASASMDRTIRLWDANTGKHKKVLEGHSKGVRSLAYSPDYRFLVSAGFDYDAYVWNPYVKNLILRLNGHTASLCNVEIIPNTPQIITADTTGVFKVWDIRNFACVQTLVGENITWMRDFVSLTPHKRLVAAGRRFYMFDYEILANPELTDDLPIFCALYNKTSLTILTGAGRDVKVWDACSGKLMRHYRNLTGSDLTSLILDDRERKFIVGDHAGCIRVYDYMNGAEMKVFAYPEHDGERAHGAEVTKLLYISEYKVVVSTSWDLSILVHDEEDPEEGVLLRRMSGGHRNDVTCAAFSHNLSLISSGDADGALQLWDFEFARLEGSCFGHTNGITALAFLDPYPGILAADNDGNVCLWGVRGARSSLKGRNLFRFKNISEGEECPVLVLVWRNPWLITGDEKGWVKKFDLSDALARLDQRGFCPTRKQYACENARRKLGGGGGGAKESRLVDKYKSHASKRRMQKKAKSATRSMTSLAIEVELEAGASWKAHNDSIYSLEYIDEPEGILTSSFDRLVKLFDAEGNLMGVLQQGDGFSGRNWRFDIDVEKRNEGKIAAAREVLDEVIAIEEECGEADEEKSDSGEYSSSDEGQLDDAYDLGADFEGSSQDLLLELKLETWDANRSSENVRKTPRLRPVDAKMAGRGLGATPRGREYRKY